MKENQYGIKRLQDETEEQFLWRVGQLVDSGKVQNWKSVNDIVNRELGIDEDNWRDESSFRKRYAAGKQFYNNCFSKMQNDNYLKELKLQQTNLQKERYKLQTEKIEYNKWLREESRGEMISETVANAIRNLEPLSIPENIEIKSSHSEYLLCFGDCHYGVEFEIKDLYGRILNAYSPEIFEERMALLLEQLKRMIQKDNIQELNVWELGDGIHSILRLDSQLMKLRYGILDSTIHYANYLANWVNELSHYVNIKFQMVKNSNHCQLRLLGAKKNSFKDEDLSKVMIELIKNRLSDNPNVRIIENPTGMCFKQMTVWNVVADHGEHRDLENTLVNFSNTYQTKIDYYIFAHKHHYGSGEVAVDLEYVSIRSVMGIDDYSVSLNKTAKAGASLFEFSRLDGLVCDHKINLN